MLKSRSVLFCLLALNLGITGCAYIHKHQIGEIDSRVVLKGRKFELLVSQTGVNIQEAAGIAAAATRHKETQKDIGGAAAIIGLFQMGPRTGNPVYNDTFADNLTDKILEQCPKGRISGLSCTRETAKYPVVSGEIIKVTGYCYNK